MNASKIINNPWEREEDVMQAYLLPFVMGEFI